MTNEAFMATFGAIIATLAFASSLPETTMSSLLAEVMFKGYRRRVLGLLLLRPDQAYHVREIARLTGTVPGTLHKELSKLAKAGILVKSSRGNQVSYQANRDCLIFDELSSILRKTSGVTDVIREALVPLEGKVDVALIFGSIASGKATSKSDVDLLIVGKASFTETAQALYPTQETLGREVNPKLYSTREWLAAREQNSAFIREILGKPIIKVLGDINELG